MAYISYPFAGQFASMAGLLQGGNQAQARMAQQQAQAKQLALADLAHKLNERKQGHSEMMDREGMDFERFKFGEGFKQATSLEELRNRLLSGREEAGRAFQGGESALDRALQGDIAKGVQAGAMERAMLQEKGLGVRQGREIGAQRGMAQENWQRQMFLEAMRDALTGRREGEARAFQAGESAKERKSREGISEKGLRTQRAIAESGERSAMDRLKIQTVAQFYQQRMGLNSEEARHKATLDLQRQGLISQEKRDARGDKARMIVEAAQAAQGPEGFDSVKFRSTLSEILGALEGRAPVSDEDALAALLAELKKRKR